MGFLTESKVTGLEAEYGYAYSYATGYVLGYGRLPEGCFQAVHEDTDAFLVHRLDVGLTEGFLLHCPQLTKESPMVVDVQTFERFHAVLDSPKVVEVCAELVDVLEAHLGGALQKEGFEMEKARLKKKLPVFTPHAHFPGGRRVNADAVPSGLAMYDKDHINDPRGWWKVIEERAKA